jgi:hypothetical protein
MLLVMVVECFADFGSIGSRRTRTGNGSRHVAEAKARNAKWRETSTSDHIMESDTSIDILGIYLTDICPVLTGLPHRDLAQRSGIVRLLIVGWSFRTSV